MKLFVLFWNGIGLFLFLNSNNNFLFLYKYPIFRMIVIFLILNCPLFFVFCQYSLIFLAIAYIATIGFLVFYRKGIYCTLIFICWIKTQFIAKQILCILCLQCLRLIDACFLNTCETVVLKNDDWSGCWWPINWGVKKILNK